MRSLSLRAKAYIGLVALGGIYAIAWASRTPVDSWSEVGLIATLAVFASLAQVFEVRTPNNKAYVATIAFLVAAAILLGPLGCVVVAMAPFLVEQLRRPKAYYIQAFNASSHILCTLGAGLVFEAVSGQEFSAGTKLTGSAGSVLGSVAAVGFFLVVNHLSLVLVLWWARGVKPRESGLLGVEGTLTDGALLALGVVVASLWSASPPLVLFALVPFVLLQRALHFPELRHASRTDSKTGLFNSAYFTEIAEEELRRAARTGQPLCIFVADLDLLRNINNAYGHLAGDVILKGVADILQEEVREYDLVARFGGEEFAILLPAADSDEGRQVAERIRGRVARELFEVTTSVTPIRATLSIGLASYGEHGQTLREIMHAADLAVYRAKVEGRDRVRVAGPGDAEDVAPAMAPVRPTSPVSRILTAQAPSAPGQTATPSSNGGGSTRATASGAATTVDSRPARVRPRRATWPITVFAFAAAAVLIPIVCVHASAPTAALIVFPLLALIAELSAESIYGSSFVSLSAVPILAAATAGRPAAAVAAAAISGLAGSTLAKARFEQFVFNTANLALCGALAAGIRLAMPISREITPDVLPELSAVMLLATAAYFLVDNGLVSLIVAADEGRDPRDVFRGDLAWLLPHFLVFGVFGTLLGVAWETFGLFGLIAFLLPPLMVRVAQKQYLAKTTSNVAELRRLADDLSESNDAIERSNVALEHALVQVRERHLATARALAGAIDARDKTTGGHIERVQALGQAMCEIVDPLLAADPQVAFGFLLHDVGKIGVPDSVLLKAGPLTDAERAIINEHPAIGEALLSDAGFAVVAREIVLTHHERWDGTGYPRGLAGTEIPLCSRIFSVADSLDAMTNDRPYRRGMDLEEAYAELRRFAGTQFDPAAVEALLSLPVEKVQELLQLGRDGSTTQLSLARMLG